MCTRLSMSVLELLVEEREKKTCLFLVKIEKKKKKKKNQGRVEKTDASAFRFCVLLSAGKWQLLSDVILLLFF